LQTHAYELRKVRRWPYRQALHETEPKRPGAINGQPVDSAPKQGICQTPREQAAGIGKGSDQYPKS
jgi:hypothetical protein